MRRTLNDSIKFPFAANFTTNIHIKICKMFLWLIRLLCALYLQHSHLIYMFQYSNCRHHQKYAEKEREWDWKRNINMFAFKFWRSVFMCSNTYCMSAWSLLTILIVQKNTDCKKLYENEAEIIFICLSV